MWPVCFITIFVVIIITYMIIIIIIINNITINILIIIILMIIIIIIITAAVVIGYILPPLHFSRTTLQIMASRGQWEIWLPPPFKRGQPDVFPGAFLCS